MMSDELHEAAWRIQLHEVIARYAHCMDSGDFDGLEALFTEDASFDIEPDPGIIPLPLHGRRVMREALEARYAVVSQDAQRRHLMTTIVVDEVSATAAATRSFLTVVSAPKSGGGVELRGTGVYHDRFVRENGAWLISERRLFVDELKTS